MVSIKTKIYISFSVANNKLLIGELITCNKLINVQKKKIILIVTYFEVIRSLTRLLKWAGHNLSYNLFFLFFLLIMLC